MSVGTKPEPAEGGREEIRGQMSSFDHLEELRQRIIKGLIAVSIAFLLCWTFADELFKIVSHPIIKLVGHLNFMTLTEPFNLELKIALVAAIFLSSPFL